MIQTIDDAPRVAPLGATRREIIGKFAAGEPSLDHPAHKDFSRYTEIKSPVGVTDEVDAELFANTRVV
ncbi:MAG: hypothetical protein ACRC7C_07960, partial [Beijerinckiaceae bacterium]